MADKLKVGIVGVGGIARTHVPGWQTSEHAELVAGSDISEDVLNTWGEQYGDQKTVCESRGFVCRSRDRYCGCVYTQ